MTTSLRSKHINLKFLRIYKRIAKHSWNRLNNLTFYFAFSPCICIVMFSKTLADKLSTWYAFHSRHYFLFKCWKRWPKSERENNAHNLFRNIATAIIHETTIIGASGFPLLNQSRYANLYTWQLQSLAVVLNFLAHQSQYVNLYTCLSPFVILLLPLAPCLWFLELINVCCAEIIVTTP